jgi:copper chaperone
VKNSNSGEKMKYLLQVNGMSCGGCVKSIQNALKKLDASSKTEVNLENKEVSVETNLEEIKVREAITLAGFDVAKN